MEKETGSSTVLREVDKVGVVQIAGQRCLRMTWWR